MQKEHSCQIIHPLAIASCVLIFMADCSKDALEGGEVKVVVVRKTPDKIHLDKIVDILRQGEFLLILGKVGNI